MSAAAKKRSNLKSGGTDKNTDRDVTPALDISQEVENPLAMSSVDVDDAMRSGLEDEDHPCFANNICKPSNLRDIWSAHKVKKKMFDFLTWYFRPKNSYDPERVDYNALNILAEYQTYNFEFLKNELDLNNDQSSNVLQALWNLLEFDPDEKSIQVEHGGGAENATATAVQRSKTSGEGQGQDGAKIAYLGDDVFDQEEEAFKTLLSKKFQLFKGLIAGTVEHELVSARITIEQARRLAIYVHETYFRHLRLYDFMLKNTKLSEVKRVHYPVEEPKMGDELGKAMVLADDSLKVAKGSLGSADSKGQGSGIPSLGAAHGGSDPLASLDGTIINRDGLNITNGTDRNNADGESVTDSDMDQTIKTMGMDRKARNVMHRVTKDWNNKIAAAVTKEIDEQPKSAHQKKR